MIRHRWFFLWFLLLVSCSSTGGGLSGTAAVEIASNTEAIPVIPTANVGPSTTNEVEPTQTTVPSSTDFFITSTPFIGRIQSVANQAPEGKFLFVELIVTHDGIGDLPSGFMDRPLYIFFDDKSVLHSAQILSAKGFDAASFGLVGMYSQRQGATGGGATGVLTALNELPYRSILRVFNGEMTERGPYTDGIEVSIEAIYQDGTIQFTIEGEKTLLAPETTWSHHTGVQVLTGIFDGFYEINSQIINHGWLDREIIQPNP